MLYIPSILLQTHAWTRFTAGLRLAVIFTSLSLGHRNRTRFIFLRHSRDRSLPRSLPARRVIIIIIDFIPINRLGSESTSFSTTSGSRTTWENSLAIPRRVQLMLEPWLIFGTSFVISLQRVSEQLRIRPLAPSDVSTLRSVLWCPNGTNNAFTLIFGP